MRNILSFSNFVNESLRMSDFTSGLSHILKYLKSKIGKLYVLPGVDIIKRKGIKYSCITYFNTSGAMRFNWLKGNESVNVHSIDFFDIVNINKPLRTLLCEDDSLVKILPVVVELFNDPLKEMNFEEFNLDEAAKKKFRVVRPDGEENVEEEEFQDKVDSMDYADPETIYEDTESFISLVINGVQKSLIICGSAGLGKTFMVQKVMKKYNRKEIQPIEMPDEMTIKYRKDRGINPYKESVDGDWIHIKGTTTAYGLYSNLYKYNGKIIVFDDCDKVFKDEVAVNILKGALDTSDTRIISWMSKATAGASDIPPRFEFKGSIIFVSNLYYKKIDEAIRTRSMAIDITMRSKDILLKMESILDKLMENDLSMKSKQEAISILKEYEQTNKIEISIRALITVAKLVQSGLPNYKSMIKLQLNNFKKG